MNIFLATTHECKKPASKATNEEVKEVEVVKLSPGRGPAAPARSSAASVRSQASPAKSLAASARNTSPASKAGEEESPGFDEGDQLEQEEEISEEDIFSPNPRRQIEQAECKIQYTRLKIHPYYINKKGTASSNAVSARATTVDEDDGSGA